MSNTSTLICTPRNTIAIANEVIARSWLHSDVDDLFLYYCLPVIMTISAISNLAFIFMVSRLRRMHTIVNMYLVIVAIADALFGVVVPTFYMSSYLSSPVRHHVPFENEFFCYVIFFLTYFSYFVSVGTITLVSFERYLAVCKPFLHRKIQSKSRAIKLTLALGVLSLALAAAITPAKGKLLKFCIDWPDSEFYNNLQTHFHTCQSMGTGAVSEILVLIQVSTEAVTLILAIVINSVLYAFIIHALSTRSIASSRSSLQDQTIQVRNQVARALVINGIVFFITQTPYRCYSVNKLVEAIRGVGFLTRGQTITCITIGRVCLYINSGVNSFVYAFSCQFYRQGFREAFSFSLKKNQNNRDTVSSITKDTAANTM